MLVYRLIKPKYRGQPLSCAGSAIAGGRWNSPKIEVLYCAATPALTVLEARVHSSVPAKRMLVTIELPDESLFVPDVPDLPTDWDKVPSVASSAAYGDAWISGRTTLALSVPSVASPHDRNVLVNPNHALWPQVRVARIEEYPLDPRLWVAPPR